MDGLSLLDDIQLLETRVQASPVDQKQNMRRPLRSSSKRTRQNSSDSGYEYDAVLTTPTKQICKRETKHIGEKIIVKPQELSAFFKLTEDPIIFQFLQMDFCKKISDKYLIAMVFAYFKRAHFKLREYTKKNFFVALYLASDIEEDEDYKHEIFPWALGYGWTKQYLTFLKKRDRLWARMDFRAVVSKKACEEIMMMDPHHWVWKRERPHHHSGAVRVYHWDEDEDSEEGYPRGPDASPVKCSQCEALREYDSASPDNASLYLSSSSDSSPEMTSYKTSTKTWMVKGTWLDMEALRTTLTAAED